MVEVEIFTPTGVLAGGAAGAPLAPGGPDLLAPLTLCDSRWYPIDGTRPSHRGEAIVSPDDILVVVTPEPDLRVHMAWYSVTLEVGPYRVTGNLATHPGFDPARAIHRPSNGFVPLRDVTIELRDSPAAGVADRRHVHVNRYAVESVASTLMLGFFFPGARLVKQEPVSAA